MTCPIPKCPFPVAGPLRLCSAHYKLVPRPQQDALAHYARHHKQGPAHRASFERAMESVLKVLDGRATVSKPREPANLPYRDD